MEYGFASIIQALTGEESSLIPNRDRSNSPSKALTLLTGDSFKPDTGSSLLSVVFTPFPLQNKVPQTFYAARGKFDTASDHNLISENFIQEKGIEDRAEDMNYTATYDGAGGVRVECTQKIRLQWCADNEVTFRDHWFHIVPGSLPFELLLGEEFIKSDAALFVNTMYRALPFRLGKRDKGTERPPDLNKFYCCSG
jgi:hypothetical protein